MYKFILIPTDGSISSDKAVSQGIALVQALGAQIIPVTVTQHFHLFALAPEMVGDTPAVDEKSALKHSDVLTAVSRAAQEAGVDCCIVQIQYEHPYEELIEAATSPRMTDESDRQSPAAVAGRPTKPKADLIAGALCALADLIDDRLIDRELAEFDPDELRAEADLLLRASGVPTTLREKIVAAKTMVDARFREDRLADWEASRAPVSPDPKSPRADD